MPRGHECVLVVDDEPSIVKILSELLGQLGYQVLSTTSGTEALRMVVQKKDQISLVIVDQSMPDLSGIDLALKLRAIHPDMPIILYSGYDQETFRRQMREIGISAFMAKPVTRSELAMTVRKVLDAARKK
ncbi:MAG: response regulator [Desulfatitalea sp.]